MPVIRSKYFVMHVVVCSRPKPDHAKYGVPYMRVLSVYQREPVCVQGAERHVGPDVGPSDQVTRAEQGQQNHEECVERGAVERVEEPWVCEAVVRLVRDLVERGADLYNYIEVRVRYLLLIKTLYIW